MIFCPPGGVDLTLVGKRILTEGFFAALGLDQGGIP